MTTPVLSSQVHPARSRRRFSRLLGDRSLHVKLVLAFLTITLLSLSTVVFFSSSTTRSELTRDVGVHLHNQAGLQALSIGGLLARQLNILQSFSLSKVLQDKVALANQAYSADEAATSAQIHELEGRWASLEEGDVLIQSRLVNAVSGELREFQSTFPDHLELLATDRYGAIVAATHRTPRFAYAQEAWWQSAWNNGQGAVYLSQPTLDERSQALTVFVAIPLYANNSREVVGVLRSTYQLGSLGDLVSSLRIGEHGGALLLLADGRYLTSDNKLAQLDTETAAQLRALTEGHVEIEFNGMQSFMSRAPVISITGDEVISRLGWSLVVYADREEALYPVTTTVRTTVVLGIGALVLASLLALLLAHRFSAPIRRLTQAAEQIATGDLSRRLELEQRDEIGMLASSFNAMADTVEKQVRDLQEREQVLSRSNQEQQALLDLVHELETPVIPLMDGVLLVPLVGHVDTRRASRISGEVLKQVHGQRVRVVIIDITGISIFDTAVARRIEDLAKSVRLLGSRVMLSGMNPGVAITMVDIGVNMQELQVVGRLEDSIRLVVNAG